MNASPSNGAHMAPATREPIENEGQTYVFATQSPASRRGRSSRTPLAPLLSHARAWLLLPFLAGLYIFAIASRGAPWRGELAWGVEFVGAIHLFVLPLIAAAAAWDGVTWGRLESLSRTVRRPLAPWLWLAVSATPALALQVVSLVVVATLSLSAGHVGPTPWLVMLNQLLAVLVAAAVGLVIGWALSRDFSLLVAFFVVLLAAFTDYASMLPLGLMGDGSTGTLIGLRPDLTNQLLRTAFAAIVVACCLAVMTPGLTPWSTTVSPIVKASKAVSLRWAGTATVTVLLLAVMVGLATHNNSYVPGKPLEATDCSDGAPKLCVLQPWDPFLAEGARRVEIAGRVLSSKGVKGTPDRFVAWWPTVPNQVASVQLVRPDHATKLVPVEDTISDVVAPLTCAFWSSPDNPPAASVQVALDLLIAVVLDAEPSLKSDAAPPTAFVAFSHQSQSTQDAWVAAAGTALATCHPEQIPQPPGL